jgi:hypothetical protein
MEGILAFDALHDHSDAEYCAFISQIIDEAARRLATSQDATQNRAAIATYIQRAYDAHLSASEITDFFCVSSDNVVDRLSIAEEEINRLVAIFDQIHEEIWRKMT